MTPRGRVVALLISLAVGAAWLTGDPNARLAASLLVAPLLIDLALKPSQLRRIAIQASTRRTWAGAPFIQDLLVRHTGTRAQRDVTIYEPSTSTFSSAAMLTKAQPREPISLRLPGRSKRRGHAIERVWMLESLYPLGFFSVRAVAKVATELITEPARVELPVDLAHDTWAGQPDARANPRAGGSEFYALREHQLDEDARGVHAMRSASVGTLVRRVLRGQDPRQVGLVLDLRTPNGRAMARMRRGFEWALCASATLTDRAHTEGTVLQVLVVASTPLRFEVLDESSAEEFTTFLAECEPCPDRPLQDQEFAEFGDCDTTYWLSAGGLRPIETIEGTKLEVLGGEAR